MLQPAAPKLGNAAMDPTKNDGGEEKGWVEYLSGGRLKLVAAKDDDNKQRQEEKKGGEEEAKIEEEKENREEG